MGMFDSIYAPCPKCGEDAEFQSKSGDCFLNVYNLHNVPVDALYGTINDQCKCLNCGTVFVIKFKTKVKAWTEVYRSEEDEEDDWH